MTRMADSKRKTITYKNAAFLRDLGDPHVTLESLLKKGVKKVRIAYERMRIPQQDDGEHQFINYHGAHSNEEKTTALFGCEFLAFDHGADQSTINLAKDKEEVDLDAISAGQNKEFLAGSVYFGACGNHIIILASRALKSRDLEDYLNWFLIEKAKVLPEGNLVHLNDHLPETKKQAIAAKGVKGINFSAPVKWAPQSAAQTPSTPASDGTSASYKVSVGGPAWDAVKAFFGGALSLPSSLSLENLADTPDLEVSLSLRWKGRHDEDEVSFLDGITSNLRHVDQEIDYEIQTRTGTIGRDEFKHFTSISVDWAKGRPKFDQLFPKMAAWLAALVRDGTIDP